MNFHRRVGNSLGFAGACFFLTEIAAQCFAPILYFAETIRQMYAIGIESLLMTSTAAISAGFVLAMQTLAGNFEGQGKYSAQGCANPNGEGKNR